MSLTRRGENTYSNYQEASRAFWRQTVLPLVNRTSKALSMWLSPAYGAPLSLRPDLDQVEALASERDALWARLDKSTFLTPNEKRTAAGYPSHEGGDELKFNPYHDDAGRFTSGPGGPRAPDGTPVDPAAKKPTPTAPPQPSSPQKAPIPGQTGKEAASDVPSWARGQRPYVGEDGAAFAKRDMDAKYGAGNYDVGGPNAEYSKIKKHGERGFK